MRDAKHYAIRLAAYLPPALIVALGAFYLDIKAVLGGFLLGLVTHAVISLAKVNFQDTIVKDWMK